VGGQAMHPLASMMMMPHMAEMMKGMAPAAPVLSQNLEFKFENSFLMFFFHILMKITC
jgi:hypothetical protein